MCVDAHMSACVSDQEGGRWRFVSRRATRVGLWSGGGAVKRERRVKMGLYVSFCVCVCVLEGGMKLKTYP